VHPHVNKDIENWLTKKIKAIRYDNGTEFQNAKLIALCGEKGNKRDYSNARTPQQNGVAERKNRTLIEAARSIDHSYTSDHLGKFEGKANDGFLVGYAAHSKAYRVYNLFSKKVEETLNLRYLEDKSNVQGTQADDSESECDEQVILVPFFPSNSFSALLPQAKIEIRRNLVPAVGDPAGSIVPSGGVPAGSVPASGVPAGRVLTGSSVPASGVPAGSIPASSVPAGGVLAGRIVFAEFGDPAASASVSAVFSTDPPATSPLPPGHHTARFPSPSDHGNHHPMAEIFSFSSYDDDFCADVTNLASNVAVDPVATKRVATIHPQSQIIRALQSLVQTQSTVQKSKFGEKPSSMAKALEDPDWVAAMQEEMQQFYNQQGIDYDEVFAPVASIKAISLFLAFASYIGFMVYQMDVKSAFLYGEIEEEVYVTQPKVFENPHNPKHVYRVIKALYGLHQAPRACYARLSTFLLKHHYRRAWCDEFEVLMKGEFEVSDMGKLTFFLGLQVKQLPDGIFISQDKYVKDMLKKFDMESMRIATTPYEVLKHKSKDEPNDAVNVYLFRSMIGSLMYLIASKPDIMFAVSDCSRHQLEAYSDSDYAGSHGDRKSTTAEYVAAASCCGQVLWIQNQMLDYGFNFMNTRIFIDNQSTICIVKNPVFHQRTKHIKIRHHFIRDAYEKNLIQVVKIYTDENVADLLTKAFDGPCFHYLIVHIGILNP
nr:hypothetical protein [Tanacetum cinerariifolium]